MPGYLEHPLAAGVAGWETGNVAGPGRVAVVGRRVASVVLVSVVALLGFATSGEATLPGRNGAIIYDVEFCDTGCENSLEVVAPRRGSTAMEVAGLGYEPAFSPHGNRLAFVEFGGDGFPTGVDVGRLVATGDLTMPFDRADVLSVRRGFQVYSPRWSRTGRMVLFAHEDRSGAMLFIVDLKTGRLSRIGPRFSFDFDPSDPGVSSVESEIDLDWASTGRIVLTRHPGRLGHIGSELAVMNAAGRGLRTLTSGHFDTSPSWSPDGTKLAFVRAKDANDDCPSVYTVRADGGNLKQITHGCHWGVAWSPDGTRIAAVRDRGRDDPSELEVIPAPGGRAERIVTRAGMEDLDWQPLPR
jgi:Tol biopolymer transport system component